MEAFTDKQPAVFPVLMRRIAHRLERVYQSSELVAEPTIFDKARLIGRRALVAVSRRLDHAPEYAVNPGRRINHDGLHALRSMPATTAAERAVITADQRWPLPQQKTKLVPIEVVASATADPTALPDLYTSGVVVITIPRQYSPLARVDAESPIAV